MNLREAAEMALNALDRVQPQVRGAIPQQDVEDAIDALRDALGKLDKTHSDECYQWHHACAIAEILRLRAALAEQAIEGDIVQVDPSVKIFGGCMVTVTEVKSWGIQGYVQSAGVEGQQYIRLKFADIERTGGRAVWTVGGCDDAA